MSNLIKRSVIFLFSIFICGGLMASEFTGNDWVNMTKRQRLKSMKTFIKNAGSGGVTIKKDAVYYSRKLDAFYDAHQDLLTQPVSKTLKTLIIMEYDWRERGVDQDKQAKEWLGEDLYKANKERMSKK